MKKMPRVDKYDPIIYPRLFWVACGLEGLNKIFEFCSIADPGNEKPGAYEQLQKNTGVLVTCPVIHKASRRLGVITIIMQPDELIAGDEAHEATHVADYMFEQLGMYSQDFSASNEPYAYLVGWAAGCISKTILNVRKENDTRRKFNDLEA